MIAGPFTKLHCCIRSDGGAAIVLVAEDRVADLPGKPVWVLGTGEATLHMSTSQWPDMTTGPAVIAGKLAFERAGVTPGDIDVAELYDAFTYMLLVTLEDPGFCKKGEAGPFVEGGSCAGKPVRARSLTRGSPSRAGRAAGCAPTAPSSWEGTNEQWPTAPTCPPSRTRPGSTGPRRPTGGC